MELYKDMIKQTHLLISGASGSGKSVVENGMIDYLANHYTDDEIGILLLDPKMIELYRWRNIKHVVSYASSASAIASELKKVESFMETRLKWLRDNNMLKYPYSQLYVFIDELADIGADKDCREILNRLARLSRAAGIHIVACTQRPSISDRLMPAELRTNLDSRLCLRVSEAKDSRMVIGRNGAEALPRHGKGYYLTPETMTPILVDIPFINETTINNTIKSYSKYGDKL